MAEEDESDGQEDSAADDGEEPSPYADDLERGESAVHRWIRAVVRGEGFAEALGSDHDLRTHTRRENRVIQLLSDRAVRRRLVQALLLAGEKERAAEVLEWAATLRVDLELDGADGLKAAQALLGKRAPSKRRQARANPAPAAAATRALPGVADGSETPK